MSNPNSSLHWSATIKNDKLTVIGQITFATTGYNVSLEKKEPQGINPLILLLEKTITPPKGIVAEHVSTITATFEERTTTPYIKVQILPDNIQIPIAESE